MGDMIEVMLSMTIRDKRSWKFSCWKRQLFCELVPVCLSEKRASRENHCSHWSAFRNFSRCCNAPGLRVVLAKAPIVSVIQTHQTLHKFESFDTLTWSPVECKNRKKILPKLRDQCDSFPGKHKRVFLSQKANAVRLSSVRQQIPFSHQYLLVWHFVLKNIVESCNIEGATSVEIQDAPAAGGHWRRCAQTKLQEKQRKDHHALRQIPDMFGDDSRPNGTTLKLWATETYEYGRRTWVLPEAAGPTISVTSPVWIPPSNTPSILQCRTTRARWREAVTGGASRVQHKRSAI